MSGDLIYVSWGGTGRGAALRVAYERAAAAGQKLTYLAILDPSTFADLDNSLMALVIDELDWLLQAHLRTVSEASRQHVDAELVVRTGEVHDEVVALARELNASMIMVGAPVKVDGSSVDELVAALASRTGATVEIIDPLSSV